MIAIVSIEDNKILLVQKAVGGEWTCPVTTLGSERDEAKLLHDFRISLGTDLRITARLGDFRMPVGPKQIRTISVFVVELLGALNINHDHIVAWRYMSKADCDSMAIDRQIKEQVIPACSAEGLLRW